MSERIKTEIGRPQLGPIYDIIENVHLFYDLPVGLTYAPGQLHLSGKLADMLLCEKTNHEAHARTNAGHYQRVAKFRS